MPYNFHVSQKLYKKRTGPKRTSLKSQQWLVFIPDFEKQQQQKVQVSLPMTNILEP